jgi:hypothetical protein
VAVDKTLFDVVVKFRVTVLIVDPVGIADKSKTAQPLFDPELIPVIRSSFLVPAEFTDPVA